MKKICCFAVLSGLVTCALQAQVTSVHYDFNSYANDTSGNWDNANGWTTSINGGYFHVSNANGFNGSSYIAFWDSGASVGGTASIANTFGAPTTSDHFSLTYSYYTGNYWGTTAGLGNSASQGIGLMASQANGANDIAISVNGTTLAGSGYSFADNNSWYDFRMDIDLGANGGNGSATVYSRETGSSTWNVISDLENVNLGLDATREAGDSSNPLNWNTLWFHHEGAVSGIDNLNVDPFTPVPEPSVMAFGGLAALGFLFHRRRAARK
jgi:PEP-CTERM motif